MGRGALTTPVAVGPPAAVRRLRPYDVHCLRVETAARPLQVGILATLDGRVLLDADGRLRLAAIRDEVERRLERIPELRRVVHRPGPLAGRPLWLDDPAFEIAHHVGESGVPSPGDDAALLVLTDRLMADPLDRSRPLWRMWLLTGLSDDRLGLLVVLHHALADGRTAMRLVRALLDGPLAGSPATEPPPSPTTPPPWGALVLDHARSSADAALGLVRPSTWRQLRAVAGAARRAAARSRQSPPSSLNAPVGPRRRTAVLRLEHATAKRAARAHGAGVNDLVLALVAGGVRALLTGRGEPMATLRARAGVAVALFSTDRATGAGNDIGTLHIPLPVAEQDPVARLPRIAAACRRAKDDPSVALEPIMRAWFGRFAPLRRSLERQRLVNLSETYLPGPPVRIDALGAPVLDLVPLAPLAGNLGLSFVALSYAGRLNVAIRADAERFPDLDVLASAMTRDWEVLSAPLSAG